MSVLDCLSIFFFPFLNRLSLNLGLKRFIGDIRGLLGISVGELFEREKISGGARSNVGLRPQEPVGKANASLSFGRVGGPQTQGEDHSPTDSSQENTCTTGALPCAGRVGSSL